MYEMLEKLGVKSQEERGIEEQFSEFDIEQILLQLSEIDSKTRKKLSREAEVLKNLGT